MFSRCAFSSRCNFCCCICCKIHLWSLSASSDANCGPLVLVVGLYLAILNSLGLSLGLLLTFSSQNFSGRQHTQVFSSDNREGNGYSCSLLTISLLPFYTVSGLLSVLSSSCHLLLQMLSQLLELCVLQVLAYLAISSQVFVFAIKCKVSSIPCVWFACVF